MTMKSYKVIISPNFTFRNNKSFTMGTSMYYVSTKGGGRGSAKCLRLMTRGEGGGSKIPKTCLRNTWMFPYGQPRPSQVNSKA